MMNVVPGLCDDGDVMMMRCRVAVVVVIIRNGVWSREDSVDGEWIGDESIHLLIHISSA